MLQKQISTCELTFIFYSVGRSLNVYSHWGLEYFGISAKFICILIYIYHIHPHPDTIWKLYHLFSGEIDTNLARNPAGVAKKSELNFNNYFIPDFSNFWRAPDFFGRAPSKFV